MSEESATPFVGVVCGMKSEAKRLAFLSDDPRIEIAISGASAGRAEGFARALVADGARVLFSVGVSGGLQAECAPGDLIIARIVRTAGGKVYAADEGLTDFLERSAAAAALSARTGTILGSDAIIGDPEEKARLARETGALAVDMESHAVARVAAETGVPFAALRAVADPHDRSIPSSAANGVAPDGSTRGFKVFAAALTRPQQFPELIRVGRDSAKGLDALGSGLFHLLPAFLNAVRFA